MVGSKKQLAVFLSRLQSFEKPSFRLEQYPTDSEIAAEILWFGQQLGDIEGKTVADLGCGTGILGIGAMMFSPKKVFFVDIDEMPIKRLRENLKLMEASDYEIMNNDVTSFKEKVHLVLQNPPFGVKSEHADRVFLEKAFEIGIYSFHKTESKAFIESLAKDRGFSVTHYFEFKFPLKNSMHFHTKKVEHIAVGCWRLSRNPASST
ncbi:MAG: methyltransferase [Nanoarchaeota archaeon]|nr:methyltransferase [Nanoarchaeota archaeon]